MKLTITGPRSVGKTTISKLVSKKLKLKYISSDEIGEKEFKKHGGLDKVIKSGKIKKIINSGGYSLILDVYQKKKNFVFDLSGGSFTSRSMPEASEKVRKIAKNKSIVIGLLPSRFTLLSALVLFNRERKRKHFKKSKKLPLLKRTIRKFSHIKNILNSHTDYICYTLNKTPKQVSEEISNWVKASESKN